MENIEQMHSRHEKEISELQSKCEHMKLSKWSDVMWAPGHLSGYVSRFCKTCGKEVKRRVHCFGCGKKMEDFEWTKEFCQEYYCSKCAPDWKEIREKAYREGLQFMESVGGQD